MFRALLCPKTHEKDSGPFDSGPDVTRSNFEKVHSYLTVINYLSILASFKMARKTCVAHGNMPYLFFVDGIINYVLPSKDVWKFLKGKKFECLAGFSRLTE